ncbi:DNA topoisomerase 2-alpha [Dermatophagoides farinae]|uniref:DNA topoisomerase (ATP-hydrolyzing) n=1 Tax=Dermatophagoides farinae TaxID=6954 RepID=A0A922IE67_DERFA|nr:DNA topoisomerase 2-alpha [Dermatophagoides farinae]
MNNERSIPKLVEGLKPVQLKIIYTCIKRNDIREIKVSDLAGSVSEMTAYRHDVGNPRYLSTKLSPLARKLFPPLDDPLLPHHLDIFPVRLELYARRKKYYEDMPETEALKSANKSQINEIKQSTKEMLWENDL